MTKRFLFYSEEDAKISLAMAEVLRNFRATRPRRRRFNSGMPVPGLEHKDGPIDD